jgi:anti-sigma factor RsiW
MSHAAEGTLQALIDGELSRAGRAEVERHLDGCAACRAEADRLRAASAELTAALALLDRPADVERAYRSVARLRWRRWVGVDAGQVLRRAAVLVVGVATVASATVPGLPLHDWLQGLWEERAPAGSSSGGGAAAPGSVPAVPGGGVSEEGADADAAGVSVLPELGRMRVVLTAPAPELRIRVRLSDDAYSDVRATGAAAGARFRTGPGRVEVLGAAGGEVEVVLPRSARSATVEVDGRPYFRKDDDGIRLLAPASDSSGSEVVFTVQP